MIGINRGRTEAIDHSHVYLWSTPVCTLNEIILKQNLLLEFFHINHHCRVVKTIYNLAIVITHVVQSYVELNVKYQERWYDSKMK